MYLDKWFDRSYKTNTFKVNLTPGDYKFRIDYYERKGSARLSFSYQEPTPQPEKQTLDVGKNLPEGGIITSSPSGINCGSICRSSFPFSSTVELRAIPTSGYAFSSWSGCDSSQANTSTLLMNSPRSVNANFVKQVEISTWLPCNPTAGWSCGKTKSGYPPYCQGQAIGWDWGDDGEVFCPEGQIAIEGFCGKKNDDFVKVSEARLKMFPSPQSSWYCQNCPQNL